MADDKLTHEKLPRPKEKVVSIKHVETWDQANDYILAAYHVCVDRMEKTREAEHRLWVSAAEAYLGAYMGVAGLKAIPGNAGLAKTKEQIADADHKADQASAAGKHA